MSSVSEAEIIVDLRLKWLKVRQNLKDKVLNNSDVVDLCWTLHQIVLINSLLSVSFSIRWMYNVNYMSFCSLEHGINYLLNQINYWFSEFHDNLYHLCVIPHLWFWKLLTKWVEDGDQNEYIEAQNTNVKSITGEKDRGGENKRGKNERRTDGKCRRNRGGTNGGNSQNRRRNCS